MYLHKFEGPIEGYCVNWLTEHGWKFLPDYQRSDMMQNAYICFLKCASRYPEVEAPHFMALFKTAWERENINLAKKCSKHRQCQSATMLDRESQEQFNVEPVGDLDNTGYLRVLIQQAPREVRMVLNLLIDAPSELLEMALTAMRKQNRRTTEEQAIERMLGLPAGSQPVQQVLNYFRQQH